MSFANCNKCGKIFNKNNNVLCADCEKIESANIKTIIDFFQAFEKSKKSGFSIQAVSLATNVKIEDIEKLFRLNKLRGYTSFIEPDCKLCGEKYKTTAHSGIFCKSCAKKVDKVIKELKESARHNPQPVTVDKIKPDFKIDEIVKPEEVLKSKKEDLTAKSGMHVKDDDGKKRYGFKKP